MCFLALHTFLLADGVVALSLAAASSLCSVRSNLSGCRTHGIPGRLLSPGAHTLFMGRTLKMRYCRTLMARGRGQPLYRDSAQLAGIGRYC